MRVLCRFHLGLGVGQSRHPTQPAFSYMDHKQFPNQSPCFNGGGFVVTLSLTPGKSHGFGPISPWRWMPITLREQR